MPKPMPVGIYDLFTMALNVYAVGALIAANFLDLRYDSVHVLHHVDTFVCAFFLLDFMIRLYTAPNRLLYFVTWGWIDLLSSIPFMGNLRWGRLIRVVRMIRVLRDARNAHQLSSYMLRHRAESAFTTASILAFLVIVFSSIAILHCEQAAQDANIHDANDALWWSFVTMTTVGYGDKYPVTSSGRVVAAMTMAVGVGLFGTFAGFVSTWFLSPAAEENEDELESLRTRLAVIERHLAVLVAQSGAQPLEAESQPSSADRAADETTIETRSADDDG